jgi:hypothetical protein
MDDETVTVYSALHSREITVGHFAPVLELRKGKGEVFHVHTIYKSGGISALILHLGLGEVY